MVSFAFKNYYERLGVTHQASDVEIRKAFRQLAQLYHPDVADSKHDAQEMFVLINEAHQALTDPSARKEYDQRLTSRWDTQSPGPVSPRSGTSSHDDLSGIRNVEWERCDEGKVNRKTMAFQWKTSPDGQRGSVKRSDLDTQAYIEITLEEALVGTVQIVSIDYDDAKDYSPHITTYRVKLPPGIWRGEQLRMVGCGLHDEYSEEYGDLYLRIGYVKHDHFRLMGTHLYTEVEMYPWDAALGLMLHVPTLNGEANLQIPEGVQPGQRFNLKNYGMPERMGGRGDLIVSVKIRFPAANTTRKKALWQALSREYGG